MQAQIIIRGFTPETFCPVAPAPDPIFSAQASVAPCAQEPSTSSPRPLPRSPPCPGEDGSPEDSGYLRTCFQAQLILKGEIISEIPDVHMTIIHADTKRSAFLIFSIVPQLMPQLLMLK